jgi:hypothetical protein
MAEQDRATVTIRPNATPASLAGKTGQVIERFTDEDGLWFVVRAGGYELCFHESEISILRPA